MATNEESTLDHVIICDNAVPPEVLPPRRRTFNRSLCSDRSQIEFPIISRLTILPLLIYVYIKNNSPTTFLGFDVTAKGFYELASSDGSYLHEMLMRIWVIIAKQGKDYKMMMQLCSIVNKWYSLVRSKWPIASFVALLLFTSLCYIITRMNRIRNYAQYRCNLIIRMHMLNKHDCELITFGINTRCSKYFDQIHKPLCLKCRVRRFSEIFLWEACETMFD